MELARETKKFSSFRKKRTLIALCAALLLLSSLVITAAVLLSTVSADDTIYKNIYVGGVNIGGMTEAEAAKAIQEGFPEYIQGKTVTLAHGEKTYDIHLDALSPVCSAEAVAEKAMLKCRDGNIISNFIAIQRLRKNKIVLPFEMKLDEQALYSGISFFGSSLLENDGIIAFDYEKNEVTIDTGKAKNYIDTDKMIKSFKTRVNTGKFGKFNVIFTDSPNANDSAELLYNMIVRKPVDAQMSFDGGRLEFIDEINGITIEREQLVKAVQHDGNVTLPFVSVPAQVTKAELKQKAFSVTLASHTTYFNSGVRGRSNNVRKAAEKINGYIMMPGDEFSYNGVVGKRTVEAGFDYADAYSGNKIIQEVGGGICQVSSTLYVAVLYSDLEVKERHNHNLPVSYVPRGMDATVSYGTLDFRFANNTDKPIMIKASANGGTLNVSINGFEKNETKKIEIYTKTIATQNFKEETIEDSSVTAPVVKQNGINGSTVETYKTVYINGEEKSRKKIHTSTYQPENKIIHIPPKKTAQPSAEESTSKQAPDTPPETVNDSPVELMP